jgi:hypothetical protein
MTLHPREANHIHRRENVTSRVITIVVSRKEQRLATLCRLSHELLTDELGMDESQ